MPNLKFLAAPVPNLLTGAQKLQIWPLPQRAMICLCTKYEVSTCDGTAFTDTGLLNGFVFSFSINPLVWFVQ